jgi:hypothetical protein
MKKFVVTAFVIAALYFGLDQIDAHRETVSVSTARTDALASALSEQKSGVQVEGSGLVAKVLPDDTDGSRHQRFILRLPSGQTLLVAHNIDIASRLPSLRAGDPVEFKGVYEWNAKGGVVHWTHRDPSGEHQAGWLKHNGETYQ